MPEDDTDVVRARRFEVVDDRQRLRATFGRLDGPDTGGEMVGFEVFDADGSARASLIDERGVGVQLSFALGGNQVLVVSAHEASAQLAAGVSIVLCHTDGAPVLDWQVDARGDAVSRFRRA